VAVAHWKQEHTSEALYEDKLGRSFGTFSRVSDDTYNGVIVSVIVGDPTQGWTL